MQENKVRLPGKERRKHSVYSITLKTKKLQKLEEKIIQRYKQDKQQKHNHRHQKAFCIQYLYSTQNKYFFS